jgi:hypothetical protein
MPNMSKFHLGSARRGHAVDSPRPGATPATASFTQPVFTVLVAIAVAVLCSLEVYADDLAFRDGPATEYMVAGVLRKGDDPLTIKLTQSLETARSPDEAVGAYTRKVLEQFPGYSVATTLVTPLVVRKCDTSI